ncbi:hypothetical protein OSB04_016667 [Centaurea solstitialis]|uniref:Reverse transcriptase domain-containing protein n=1 Tax=Centaurea solstitialis TaxID=347529 RepID=A0AA38W8Q3_9ASTR|nr:hypothetical protein OSB04_016667 [Centaurea solstitialis]
MSLYFGYQMQASRAFCSLLKKGKKGQEGRKVCYEFRRPDHSKDRYSALNKGLSSTKQRKQNKNPDVVTGTFFPNDYSAAVLFDSGADRSYVSLEFRPKINKKSQKLKEEHIIEYSNGELVRLTSFDIIVGMDWMSNHRATIYWAEKIVRLALPDGGVLEVHGEKPKRDIKLVSFMKMRSHLRKECVAFMAHVVDKKAKEKQIQDIPIVREFLEVFPEELPGLPPKQGGA